MPSLATPAFGFANTQASFNTGVRPKIAINDLGVFVTTFSDQNNQMYYAIGTVDGVRVQLQQSKKLQSASSGNHAGFVPAVAMNETMVVEMHVNNQSKNSLYYSSGAISGAPGSMTVSWSGTTQYDDGLMPALTNIDGNTLIEFHISNGTGKIYYHVGTVGASGVTWADGGSQVVSYGGADIEGENVSAQLDGSQVVIAYEHNNHLYYAIGTLNSDTISWLCNVQYDGGHAPSVVLQNDLVYEFHEGDLQKLWQRVGQITVSGSTTSIEWQNWLGQAHGSDSVEQYSYEYDVQYVPAVAGAGTLMVQVCASGDEQKPPQPGSRPVNYSLYCSASRLIDRGNWMGDNIAALKTMTLSDLAMPASHDAGMYTGNLISKLARTQNLDFLGQCLTGSRYFDIRPIFIDDDYYCYHHYDTMLGAKIDDVLDDLATFLTEWSSQELLILKLSHYNNMLPSPDNTNFMGLIDKITAALGDWLVAPPATGKRFADMDLASLIGTKGGVLVVCDGLVSGALAGKNIYAYRDWQSEDPQNGDLTVFDIYSDATGLNEMMNGLDAKNDYDLKDTIPYLPNGQIPKWQGPGADGLPYTGFTGTCYNNTDVPCDMFLLSWTLTPATDVWDYAQQANGALVDNIPTNLTNGSGRAINLIYVDYVSYSHATDVACVRNGFVNSSLQDLNQQDLSQQDLSQQDLDQPQGVRSELEIAGA